MASVRHLISVAGSTAARRSGSTVASTAVASRATWGRRMASGVTWGRHMAYSDTWGRHTVRGTTWGRFRGSSVVALREASTVAWCDMPGLVAYGDGLAMQREIRERVLKKEGGDVCLCLEHEAVYTLGRKATEDNLLSVEKSGAEVMRVERGGEVTFHGPGQVVLYFLLDLHRHKADVRWFVHSVEEVVIQALAHFGVEGRREPGLPGVWVGDTKVAACGISVSRWGTMHGLSINVDPDMTFFDHIVPCGIQDKGVTSLRHLLGTAPTVPEVKAAVRAAFTTVFEAETHTCDPTQQPWYIHTS